MCLKYLGVHACLSNKFHYQCVLYTVFMQLDKLIICDYVVLNIEYCIVLDGETQYGKES